MTSASDALDPGHCTEGVDPVEALHQVGRALAQVVRLVEQAGGAERQHLVGQIRAVIEAHGAATRLGMAGAAWAAADPQILAAWLHDLRNLVNGLLGWAHVLGRSPRDEATRLRAGAAIDRTAKLLTQFVSQLPG